MSGRYKAVASGAITNGKPVIVNTDGTVTQISETAGAVGTAVVFKNSESIYTDSTFDSNSNRIVVAYRDSTNGDNGYAVVGTVDSSDNSISFGTPVIYNSGSSSTSFNSITFDSNSNKVVISYQDGGNSSSGTAIVGTVDPSDNSISFGSEAVFESASTRYITSTFDSNSNKVVISYDDQGNSNYGTSVVATVSGTSISFGTPVVFNSGGTLRPTSTFDSSNNKVVIAYRDNGNSSHGAAIVGTVSGTAISFGSEVVFEAAATNYLAIAFDSNSNKVVITYVDQGNSSYGTAIVGTVSGTSISFGSAVVHRSASINEQHSDFNTSNNVVVLAYTDTGSSNKIMITDGTVSGTSISFSTAIAGSSGQTRQTRGVSFDSNVNRTVISYTHEGGSDYGTSIVYASGTPTNITSENYIGLSNACSFHGATETYTVTVASGALYGGGGTGNVFYLNGLSNPPIQLLRGHTYIFDQADSSNSGHPLHFKNTGGSQYTTGVTVTGTAGQAGAKVTIVIPIDATEPSQYYCTSHGNGMGNLITIEESFAEIDIVGTINKHQSGLTAGQTYFVQTDGTLGTSADDPSVVAGTAISATELIVKG